MKRFFLCLLALCLMLSGCGSPIQPQSKHYTATFLNLFDTVTTIIGPGKSEADFQEQAQQLHDRLETYHKLFDIYHEYEGLNNLKTVNEQAGVAPVSVGKEIIDLLTDCKEYYHLTGGKVNIAMGSVLSLWHTARNNGIRDPLHAQLPDSGTLKKAAEHTSIHSIIIDQEAFTVFITDPEVQLDVGAVAKGWACQRVAETAPTGFLLSVGGNVCATGPKTDQGNPWVIGIQDPDNSSANLHTIRITGGSVVTSGDYQRSYQVDGKSYHHIIDPATLNPGTLWRSVSVVCHDSALADALSTSLFLLPLEEGKALAANCNVQVFWLDHQGKEYMTEDFQALIRT